MPKPRVTYVSCSQHTREAARNTSDLNVRKELQRDADDASATLALVADSKRVLQMAHGILIREAERGDFTAADHAVVQLVAELIEQL